VSRWALTAAGERLFGCYGTNSVDAATSVLLSEPAVLLSSIGGGVDGRRPSRGCLESLDDHAGRVADAIERGQHTVAVTPIQVDVIARGLTDLQTDGLSDNECDRLRFEFADIAISCSFSRPVQQLVGELVDENDEFLGRRKPSDDLDAPASGNAERSAEIIDVCQHDSVTRDRLAEISGAASRISNGRSSGWQRFAICLRDILSRDSATRSRQRSPGCRGRTCTAPIRASWRYIGFSAKVSGIDGPDTPSEADQ
jgi:hypothetical protein